MKRASILVVDDEKNIRLTVREALRSLDGQTDTAINGEEALVKIEQRPYDVVFLDLKLPGMDGLEVLRRVRQRAPNSAVVLITAHGTIEVAVDAMKLGAVDFLQKPFAPQEIRDVASRVLSRQQAKQEEARDYGAFIASARQWIENGDFDAATEQLRTAISIDPAKPEGFNLLGAVSEMQLDLEAAIKYYRTAYWLDPTYEPARENIEQTTQVTGERRGPKEIRLGDS